MEIYSEVPTAKTRALSSGWAGNLMARVADFSAVWRPKVPIPSSNRPLNCVELRGFEPLTPSMRRRLRLWPVVADLG
jgi:hypothetical protein